MRDKIEKVGYNEKDEKAVQEYIKETKEIVRHFSKTNAAEIKIQTERLNNLITELNKLAVKEEIEAIQGQNDSNDENFLLEVDKNNCFEIIDYLNDALTDRIKKINEERNPK